MLLSRDETKVKMSILGSHGHASAKYDYNPIKEGKTEFSKFFFFLFRDVLLPSSCEVFFVCLVLDINT